MRLYSLSVPPARARRLALCTQHGGLGDAADARACLGEAERSGLGRTHWARLRGIDARSLNAWRVNLERHGGSAGPATVRLVELVAAPQPTRYVVRVGDLAVEVDERFDERTLHRLLQVVLSC